MGFANVINAIRKNRKIVVGRIQGKAIGGGVGLAAACDYTFATKYASTRLSELAVGIGPFVIGHVVERKMGLAAFSQMALSPDVWRSAAWSKENGLFSDVFEDTGEMDVAIDDFIEQLLQYHPLALEALKKVFWEGCEEWDELLEKRAIISGQLLLSEFSRKAIQTFLNK